MMIGISSAVVHRTDFMKEISTTKIFFTYDASLCVVPKYFEMRLKSKRIICMLYERQVFYGISSK